VTAAAGSRGTATVALVTVTCALTFGALVAVAACCVGFAGITGTALAAAAGRLGVGGGLLRSSLTAIAGVGRGCCKQHQSQRNRRKDQTEERHGGLLLTAPKVGPERMGRSLPERDTLCAGSDPRQLERLMRTVAEGPVL
jgi:hypothetical protein